MLIQRRGGTLDEGSPGNKSLPSAFAITASDYGNLKLTVPPSTTRSKFLVFLVLAKP